jgi:hypothetical protein
MDFLRRFGVRIVMVLERQSEEAKASIEKTIEQKLQRFDHHGINVVPLPALMVSAQKPTQSKKRLRNTSSNPGE